MRTLQQGHCVRVIPLNIAVGALNITTDTAMLILPVPILKNLQVSKGRLLVLSAVFATGLLYVHDFRAWELVELTSREQCLGCKRGTRDQGRPECSRDGLFEDSGH